MKLFSTCPHKTWDKEVQETINNLMNTDGELVLIQWACKDCLMKQCEKDPELRQAILSAEVRLGERHG